MPNRYYTAFSQGKISARGARPSNPSGPTDPGMPKKQGYCQPNLPGKASAAFAKAKAGFKEVNGYANYEGLSKVTKNWIAGAIKHKGALTKKAKKAGESPMDFAHDKMHASGKTGQQARLAMTLSKLRK